MASSKAHEKSNKKYLEAVKVVLEAVKLKEEVCETNITLASCEQDYEYFLGQKNFAEEIRGYLEEIL